MRAMRVVGASAAAAVLAWACGAPQAPGLKPAGSREDDGTGQLAEASVRLRRAGGEEGVRAEDRYERQHDDDPGAYGGFGYGGLGYGGFGYGGLGYGGFGYGAWGIGYGPGLAAPPPYTGVIVGDAGAIEGSVRWKSGGGVAWPAGCDAARVARAGAGVSGAVVYLDGVRTGRMVPFTMAAVKSGGVATVSACAIAPTTQLAGPLPTQLVVENGDTRAVKLRHERPGGVTTADLEPGGRTHLPIERAGDTRLWDGVRAPAWVVAQAHPYYVVTGDDGRFVLDEVPPGTWTLVVWYPPLVTSVGVDGPVWGAATVERRRVTVAKSALARADVELTPAR
ncbi:MAG TPA: carboxypeptidase-like regulatory domain-containing protein [Kofleriaceae bacterium]|nr:carboxypeptidase-like regulatory domain-containing protein [Kofleriaceae bacterium]